MLAGRTVAMLAAALAVAVAIAVGLSSCASMNPDYDPARSHHRPGGFANTDGSVGGKPLSQLLKWAIERQSAGLPKPPSTFVQGYTFPVRASDRAFLAANRTQDTATFVGHATMLMQLSGLNIVTDPQFSDRAFMVQWAGPQRKTRLPLRVDELPRIDVVVVSHNHYDHLDRDTVLALNAQPGGPPRFLVPLGVDRWMKAQGIDNVEGLDWWESRRIGEVDVHFVPVHHWSARTPFDRNATLWGGWVFRSARYSFFFAGDTGYSDDFARIGERFGGVDLALIPVGAYEPRWFMSDQHVDPSEAVRIHRDVRARDSIGVHWGTFELTDESLDEPIGALRKALDDQGISRERFTLLEHGQTRVLERRTERTGQ